MLSNSAAENDATTTSALRLDCRMAAACGKGLSEGTLYSPRTAKATRMWPDSPSSARSEIKRLTDSSNAVYLIRVRDKNSLHMHRERGWVTTYLKRYTESSEVPKPRQHVVP